MFTQNKMDAETITAALWGRLMRNELEQDLDSLVAAISKQTEIPLERCKEIMMTTDAVKNAMNLAIINTIPKKQAVN